LSGLLFFSIVYIPMVFILQHNFPNLDEHVGAVIDLCVSAPLGWLFGLGVNKHVMLKLFPDGESTR
jgi:hypothetical protein